MTEPLTTVGTSAGIPPEEEPPRSPPARPASADGDDDAPSSLKALQLLVGLLAGVAALIYVTGGLVLGLRLMFAGLPALGVVAQLPREFLVSLGFSLVLAPAVLFGITAGVLETAQGDQSLVNGHRSWANAKCRSKRRRAYVAFYSVAPVLIATPGLVVAVFRDDKISQPWPIAAVVLIVAAGELAVWAVLAVCSSRAGDPDPDIGKEKTRLQPHEWACIASGALLALAFSAWVGFLIVDSPRYGPLLGVWFIGLLTALLVVWIRGLVGDEYRRAKTRARQITLTVISWAAFALLAVPACAGAAAASSLERAVLCSESPDSASYTVSGDFVGETKDHVYIGANGRIVSVPTDKVTRLTIGDHRTDIKPCTNSQ
jgi:hypothetical protein